MEESEVPLEHLHEHVKESAEDTGAVWISWVALSTAVLAVLAAIAGLLSAHHVNEAMMNQIEASDQWSYYQAKSIKASVLDAKMSLAGTANESDRSKYDRYEKEQEQVKSEAERKEAAAKSNFHKHEVFARGVTMFQIARQDRDMRKVGRKKKPTREKRDFAQIAFNVVQQATGSKTSRKRPVKKNRR